MCFSPLTDPGFSCLERLCGQHSEAATFTWQHHVIALRGLPDTWRGSGPSVAEWGRGPVALVFEL